ncbi:MAG TPA: MarR family transcriptional regulator [Micromonospora sp.]|nr:MarR family transcriptional regulator [Micromonospora sp.]
MRSDREELIARIMAAQSEMQRMFIRDRSHPFFSLQLTVPQLRLLLLLSLEGGAGGQELSRAMGVSLATVTGIVDRLVAQDLVLRREDPHDRRVRRVELSPAGRQLVDRLATAGIEGMQKLLDRLSLDDLRTLDRANTLVIQAAAESAADPALAERGDA